MRKLLFLSMFMVYALCVSSQTMKEMWINMPDSILTYLTKDMRTELVGHADGNGYPRVVNLLADTTTVDTLTDNYIAVDLSETSKVEMRMLSRYDDSIIICMSRTFYGPMAESVVSFYDKEWHKLKNIYVPEISFTDLLVKPVDMSEETFDEIRSMISPKLVEASLSPLDDTLLLRCSVPELCKEETDKIKSILVQRKIKWDGKTFN